jgi:hypothetical protein
MERNKLHWTTESIKLIITILSIIVTVSFFLAHLQASVDSNTKNINLILTNHIPHLQTAIDENNKLLLEHINQSKYYECK